MRYPMYNVILGAHITEKCMGLLPKNNQVVFKVSRFANKQQVREAIKGLFKVKVVKVRLINVEGKKKRIRNISGKRANWKKAYITLQKGEEIEMFHGIKGGN